MKIDQFLKATFAAACAVLCIAMPALAQTDGKGDSDTEPAVIVEVSATPLAIVSATPTPQPFSVSGNATVIDDIEDNSKEFYTITTENNNTFFIVVDKASSSQNVYMLAKVDENDVAEFVEGGISTPEPTPQPQATVIIQQPTPAPTAEVVVTETVEAKSETPNVTTIAIAGAAVVGGLIYWKVSKTKKDRDYDDSEGMEYDDSVEQNDEE